MRPVILVVLILALCSCCFGVTWTEQTGTYNSKTNDAGASTDALAFGGSLTAGATLVMMLVYYDQGFSTLTITVADGTNGAWTCGTKVRNTTSLTVSYICWFINSAGSVTPTVTATYSISNTAQFRRMMVTSFTVDQTTVTADINAGGTFVGTNTMTATLNPVAGSGELLIGFIYSNGVAPVFTAGTCGTGCAIAHNDRAQIAMEWGTSSAGGSTNVTATIGSNQTGQIFAASFIGSSGGGSTTNANKGWTF